MNTVRFACVLLILIAGLQTVAPSQAAPAKDEAVNPGIVEYARTYGVSIEEARWRLSKEKYIGEVGHRIETGSPETFAGIWIEHKPVFRAVVRFVGDAKAQLSKYTQDPLFVPQVAPRSYEVLVAVQADIAQRLANDGIDFESDIDIKKSEITLYVRDPALVLKKYALVFRVSPFIRVYKTNTSVELTAMSGGQELDLTLNHRLVRECTAGFNVFDGNRELGIITAGHCVNDLTYKPTRTKLDYQNESDDGNYDVQWSKQHIRQSVTPEQQKNSIDLINGPIASMDINGVTPSTSYTVGKTICKSGVVTGYNCGQVIKMNHLELYPKNTNHVGSYVEVHNANDELMTDFGDSGGPVFAPDDNSAYGVIHGHLSAWWFVACLTERDVKF
jgi:hypothetical protein